MEDSSLYTKIINFNKITKTVSFSLYTYLNFLQLFDKEKRL